MGSRSATSADRGGRAASEALAAAAGGGRVASSPFLAPADADALAADLRTRGVGVSVDGGRPAAERRVVTAHPTEVPHAGPRLAAVWFAQVRDEGTLRAAAVAAGVDAGALGDVVLDADGAAVVVLGDAVEALLEARPAGTAGVEVPLERLAQGRTRRSDAVVPSLRIDAVGAKAFGVSRSWFTKGIAAGRVHVNGVRAGKSVEAAAGDEVWADGLGRFRVLEVHGETRRGNLKVTIEVEG
jgi:RNA-binding protein YlmH